MYLCRFGRFKFCEYALFNEQSEKKNNYLHND